MLSDLALIVYNNYCDLALQKERYKLKKILFVCSQNKLRSPTAEVVFSEYDTLEVRSAGLNNNAEIPIGNEDVEWADIIFIMEQGHKSKLKKRFKAQLDKQKVICLGIPDDYEFMQEELVVTLKQKVTPFIQDYINTSPL